MHLAKRGCLGLALVDKDEKSAAQTQELIGRISADIQMVVIACDVRDESQVNQAISLAAGTFSRIDYAANCAGVSSPHMGIANTSLEIYERTMAINSTGTFICCKALVTQMAKQKVTEGTNGHSAVASVHGAIVNIASIAGLGAIPGIVPYNASKHAVIGITKSVAVDNAAPHCVIRCNAVCPVSILTAV